MNKLINSFIFLFIALFSTSQAFSITANSTDSLTLITIKSMISDPFDALSWGNTTLHFCQWVGVTCGRRHHERVVGLVLDSFNLVGTVPPHIANLTFLRKLLLPNNSFSGSIPSELGHLPRLTDLNLSANYFDGELPANLTHWSNLQFFDVCENKISGVIPRDIGSLIHLQILNLGQNNFTGTIPLSLGNLTSLYELFLQENDLSGSISESIGSLSSLKLIQLRANNLAGNIPSSIYNLSSLQIMSLGNNRLTGTLPPTMFNTLPNLQTLILSNNRLEGRIPFSLSNATSMEDIEIRENFFSGTIPSMVNSPYLYWINLGGNLLQAKGVEDWEFLNSMSNCNYLVTLVVDSSNLGGALPLSIGNLSSTLQYLVMGWNHIAGILPEGVGNLENLHVLNLAGNQLTGHIPDVVGNLGQLNYLQLRKNSLSGTVPASIGECWSLQKLDVSENKLTGSIPKELLMLSSLSIYLDLSHNFFSGTLPLEVGRLTNLNALNISYNLFSGGIPTTLRNCRSLKYLHMQGNSFDGDIPRSLSELKGLRELDLSLNNLSGDIQEYKWRLSDLQYLNLSYNNLEGEVPKDGVFGISTTTVSVLGNKKLCGGSPKLHLPPCTTQHLRNWHRSHILGLAIPALGACLSFILLVIMFTARRRLKIQRNTFSYTNLMERRFRKVSYAELLKATDGFSQSNLIGTGSVGNVYKGILDMDKSIVAVKVLNLQRQGASKSFMAECDVLRSIRHRNLVKILTVCSSVDFSGNDFKALVLEFMPNGSLEKWLHPAPSGNSELTGLAFADRLNIAIDVASALEYLHHYSGRPIVHCDLKPSNIFLDANMSAHVGDFGLARFISDKLPRDDEQITTIVGGTIGYIAPEYGMGGQASTYGDIYSYGILLLELFTGKRPTDESFMYSLSLHNYAQRAYPEGVRDIIDSRLHFVKNDQDIPNRNGYSVEEYGYLVSLIGIGLQCSHQDPGERPKMEDVTKELHNLRYSLHKFRTNEG